MKNLLHDRSTNPVYFLPGRIDTFTQTTLVTAIVQLVLPHNLQVSRIQRTSITFSLLNNAIAVTNVRWKKTLMGVESYTNKYYQF